MYNRVECLNFIHLSDIHFHCDSDNPFDLDLDLRNHLTQDIISQCPFYSQINGILITGDIAFSGKEEEYNTARKWLKDICSKIGCDEDLIWMVPGNHDVDRERVDAMIRNQQTVLRTTSPQNIDREIYRAFETTTIKTSMFEPIREYVRFASNYSCEINSEKPIWYDDLILNDGSFLRLCGLNSVLVSNSEDNLPDKPMVLGTYQAQIKNEDPDVTCITLCHHPQDWLSDPKETKMILNVRGRIQLYGHKHSQKITPVDNGKTNSVQLVSGAIHPVRREPDWLPRYNILSMCIVNENKNRYLKLTINPRSWDKDTQKFEDASDRDGSLCKHMLFLSPLKQSRIMEKRTDSTFTTEALNSENSSELKVGESLMKETRHFTYHLLQLPYTHIIQIALDIGLLKDDDAELPVYELAKQICLRAKEVNKIEELKNLVYEKLPLFKSGL